jgi:NADH-quinone oxidoreductase subunit L
MTVPMMALAAASVVGGYLLIFGGGVQHWLTPVVGSSVEVGVHTVDPTVLSLLTLVVVAGGVAAGYWLFQARTVPAVAPVAVSPITTAARLSLYGDAVNEALLMRPGQYLTRFLIFLDARGVDGAVNGLAALLGGGSSRSRRLQTGFVRSYALSMLGGATVLVAALLLVRIG